MKKTVSFISVNYNGIAQTSDFIRSVQANVHSCPYEIIIVDNGSRNDEAAALKLQFPCIKTIRSAENLGFAGGNDIEILEDHIDLLCKALEEHPDAGMVCPKICFFSDKSIIQYAGYTPMKGFRMKNEMLGYGKKDDGSFDRAGFTAFPHGAAMLIRREAITQVGPMPEVYFLYYEELDWALMFSRKGWIIYFEPSCTIYHKDSLTTRRHGPVFTYYMTRSRLIFAQRNLEGFQRVLSILFTRYVASFKHLIVNLMQGRLDSASAIVRAHRDFIRMKMEDNI